MKSAAIELSIVVPVFNEEENIEPLVEEVLQALGGLDRTFEIILVDDGSSDGTLELLREMHQRYPDQVHFVSFSRNRGQTAAFIAGFRAARGRYVATLDGDMQNDPTDLPDMLVFLEAENVDMVNGIRKKRRDNWIRKVSSKVGNGFRNWMTKEEVTDVGCSIRIMKQECLREIPAFNGLHRFFPTLVRMRGFSIAEMPVNHRERERGTSKYGVLNRAFVGFRDTLAVRWMQNRVRNWTISESSLDETGNQK